MSAQMKILSAGPALTLQDMGRGGYLSQGLTRGGAADTLALFEGAALLGQSPEMAALEMVGMGGTFEVTQDTVIALSGARMTVTLDGAPLAWNASHLLSAGAKLVIGGVQAGTYGYLHVAGGFDTPQVMGARSAHLTAGVGAVLGAGETLPIGQAKPARSGYFLAPSDRSKGGVIRVLETVQTQLFSSETRERFAATTFKRDARGNRQGVRMDTETEGFFAEGGLSIVSEVILPGDIQITGDGAPYVLMCECQTTGGYPRIATVLPADLPKVAQASVGAPLLFQFVTLEEAIAAEKRDRAERKGLGAHLQPLIRDPHDISDLLSYQLVGGAISATADPFET